MSSNENSWETDFINYLEKHRLVSGWVKEQTDKIVGFLKDNYTIINGNETWYDEKYVKGLQKENQALREQIQDIHKNYILKSPLELLNDERSVANTLNQGIEPSQNQSLTESELRDKFLQEFAHETEGNFLIEAMSDDLFNWFKPYLKTPIK